MMALQPRRMARPIWKGHPFSIFFFFMNHHRSNNSSNSSSSNKCDKINLIIFLFQPEIHAHKSSTISHIHMNRKVRMGLAPRQTIATPSFLSTIFSNMVKFIAYKSDRTYRISNFHIWNTKKKNPKERRIWEWQIRVKAKSIT